MNNIQKTPEQQIEEVVESLKALFLPQARNHQEADEMRRRLDSLGHEAKAVSAIVNDRDIYKAAIHKILSELTSSLDKFIEPTISSLPKTTPEI